MSVVWGKGGSTLAQFRRWLILSHRYLGIGLGLLFVVWFASGIGMIYARGMPSLTDELRLERLAPLDLESVRVTPLEAAERAGLGESLGRVTLLTLMDRPAYRLGGGGAATVFADTGELMPRGGSRSGTRGGESIHGPSLGADPLRATCDAVRPVDHFPAHTAPVSQAEHRRRTGYSALRLSGIGRGGTADYTGQPCSRLGLSDPPLALLHSAAGSSRTCGRIPFSGPRVSAAFSRSWESPWESFSSSSRVLSGCRASAPISRTRAGCGGITSRVWCLASSL